MAQIRRKRLEQAHKMILIEQLQEKQHRHDRLADFNKKRAQHSYLLGIQMRDQFYKTAHDTWKEERPYDFE